MNVLQRRMFAAGDVAIQMPQEVIDLASELNVDITGKSAEEVEKALEAAILQPKLIGKGGLSFFDYTDPLDYGLAALGLTGLGTGAATVAKSAKMAKKIKSLTDALNRAKKVLSPLKGKKPGFAVPGKVGFQPRNPLNPLSYNYKLPQSSFYGSLALGGIKSQQSSDINSMLDKVDMLEALKDTGSNELNGSTKNAKTNDKQKTNAEIEAINSVLAEYDLSEKINKEAFIQEKQERKNRNTGIFLNEMSKAAAGTDNLADAIAIGAANASDAVMKADETERLAYAEFLKEEEGKNAPPELKESDIRAISETYSDAASALGKSTILKKEVGTLKNILQNGYATGATGFTLRLADKIQGFFGADGYIKDATAAKNLSLFLEVRLVEAVLDEKGKTISDADRKLIKDIVGNLESPLSNKASVINLLGIVETTLNKKIADAEKIIRYNKIRYGDRIPELAIFDEAEGIASKEQEEEVSIADRDDVIT